MQFLSIKRGKRQPTRTKQRHRVLPLRQHPHATTVASSNAASKDAPPQQQRVSVIAGQATGHTPRNAQQGLLSAMLVAGTVTLRSSASLRSLRSPSDLQNPRIQGHLGTIALPFMWCEFGYLNTSQELRSITLAAYGESNHPHVRDPSPHLPSPSS